jgi:DNA replication protein DnaC
VIQISRIEKQDLLILDDFGLLPMDAYSRATLMEIIEDRHGKRSTMIASQLPVQQWHDIIGVPTIPDAIPDRPVHDAHRMELIGESLRKRKKVNELTEINKQE